MAVEDYANSDQTTLSGGITAGAATLVVASAAAFPAAPQFRILIDSEIMVVTAVAGTTFTVTRGAEGTTAATHSNGATVTGMLTAGGLKNLSTRHFQFGLFANLPASADPNSEYYATDTKALYYWDGAAWQTTNFNAAAIASGTMATARLGGGTANNTTFLRGDQTYAAPPAGGNAIASTAFGSEPGSPATGDLDLLNNGCLIERYSGSAWVPWGPVNEFVAPNDGSFSWVNQGGGSVDTTRGGVYLLAPAQGGGENPRVRYVATPGVAYTLTAYIVPIGFPANYWEAGLRLLDNTNKSVTFGFNFNAVLNFSIDKFNADFTYNASYGTFPTLGQLAYWASPPHWFRIQDDGTNLKFSLSSDGDFWLQVESHVRTDFITPTRIGYFANAVNASHDCGVRLLSWNITTP